VIAQRADGNGTGSAFAPLNRRTSIAYRVSGLIAEQAIGAEDHPM
jgi:hypothetical protein